MRKVITAIAAVVAVVSLGFAIFQSYNPVIQGKVLDKDGSPIKGALVKIANKSTDTDANGNFTIRIRKDKEAEVEVSKEGYITLKQTISSKNTSNDLKLILLRATKLNLVKVKGTLTIGVSKNHLRQFERRGVHYPVLSVDIEMWKLIAKEIGVNLNVKFYKDGKLAAALKNKEVDLILGNEQFLKNSGLLIGMPYYNTSQVACIKAENKAVKTVKDSGGKKIGVAKDSQAGIEAVKSIKGIPVFYDTYSASMLIDLKPFKPLTAPIRIDKPINAEVDASLFDKFVVEYSGAFTGQFSSLDIKSPHDNFAFACLLEDGDFANTINNTIKNSRQNDISKYRDIADNCFWMYME